jgi:hypothetical protein
MAKRIFINYHPDDKDIARYVYDRLEQEFGLHSVLRDWEIDSTPDSFKYRLHDFDVMLVVVGSGRSKIVDFLRSDVEAMHDQERSIIVLLERWPPDEALQRALDFHGLTPRRISDLPWITKVLTRARLRAGESYQPHPESRDRADLDPGPPLSMPSPAPSMPIPSAARRKLEPSVDTPNEVQLGVSAPAAVSAGESFVARFAAYTDANRNKVKAVVEREAPKSELRFDLDRCQWRFGTKVTVRLNNTNVPNPVQSFIWDGSYKILRFDVTVPDGISTGTLILSFDVAVEGMPIISIRPEIKIARERQRGRATALGSFVEVRAPKSAFASYVTSDRMEVLSRIRSLQIFTGIDVFLDCLSIRPGEQWKPKLRQEIVNRDIFWLFWSREAMKSAWVDWEWRTALAAKTISGIQPHPLEPSDVAPAPMELAALQFGALYEWHIVHLRQSWLSDCWRRVGLWFRTLLGPVYIRYSGRD